MTINTIIVDDEPKNIENIREMISRYTPEIFVVATAQDADNAVALIEKLEPELLLLDIQMPGKSGFDVLKSLRHLNFEVIFITAYDTYGIQAIKFSALDYLLKPINPDEFKIAIMKATERLKERRRSENIENLLLNFAVAKNDVKKIALPTLKETRYVSTTELLRCEAMDNYTSVHLTNGERILVCRTLREFNDLLGDLGFLRSHQSHLVNVAYVRSYLKEDGGKLMLKDGTMIPVSRHNRELVKHTLENC